MQAFTHSAFLQALGYAIANSLWQVALLWGAVSFVNSVFKSRSAIKYHIALSAQLVAFCWFLFTFSFYYHRSEEAFAAVQLLRSEDVHAIIVSPQQQNFSSWILATLIKVEQALPYLSVAYLLLFFILL
ncbi:MAG: regulatory sensor-transducer, BlaR1/MecR1 family, partial [Chitinophagaceae bacterium]|nr:regulatory sensor-transducer, BlaR1/MecR1 family [Chitinophagaceae bacterium]